MDFGYTEDAAIVALLMRFGHKPFVLWSVIIDLLYQRNGKLPLKGYVISELADRARMSELETQESINALIELELLTYDKANEKISSDRVTLELDLRDSISKAGTENAKKRWNYPPEKPDLSHKAPHVAPQMGSHKAPQNNTPYPIVLHTIQDIHTVDTTVGSSINCNKDEGKNTRTRRPNVPLTGTASSALSEQNADATQEHRVKLWAMFRSAFPHDWRAVKKSKVITEEEKSFMALTPEEMQTAVASISKFFELYEPCTPIDYLAKKWFNNVSDE